MRKAAKYLEMFKVTLLTDLAYVYDILARQVFLAIVMFVFVQLWRTTYRWEGASTIAGFTMGQMIWYLALSESIVMGMPQAGADVDLEVKSGTLAYSLTKPYSYPMFHYAKYMGDAAVRFVWNILVAGAVTWTMAGPPAFTVASVLTGTVSVLLGFTLDFWAQMSLGLLSFWIEDTYAVRFLYSRVKMLLGGMMLPLDVFPGWLRRIAGLLPVSKMVYGPVRSYLWYRPREWALLVAAQVGWTALAYAMATLIYSSGVKKLNVQGG